jgi:hypothetical protein
VNITVVVLDIRGRGVQVALADGDGDAFWLPRLRPAEWSSPPEIGEAVNVYVPAWLARKHKPLVALRQSTQKHLAFHMDGVTNITGDLPMADRPEDAGRGFLARNERREKPSQPEFTGKLTIHGTEYRLAAWVKEKDGKKFFSLAVNEIGEGGSQERRQSGGGFSHDDRIPFGPEVR